MPEPTKPISTELAAKYDAYIAWLATTDSDRITRSLPRTKTAFAESIGISPRMLNKYEADPRFIQRRTNAGQAGPTPALVTGNPRGAAPQAPPAPVPGIPGDPDPEPESSEEDDYRAAKAALVRNARLGDKASLDLYLKYYGKPFIEDENAARNTDLVNLETPALVARAVLWLAPDELAAELRSAGWKVTTAAEAAAESPLELPGA